MRVLRVESGGVDGAGEVERTRARGKVDFEHLPPEQLAADILKKEQRITEIMGEIKILLGEGQ